MSTACTSELILFAVVVTRHTYQYYVSEHGDFMNVKSRGTYGYQ